MASYDTFISLKNYVKGKLGKRELEDSDPNIHSVKEDNSNLGQSIIKIEFENDDEFWKIVGLHEDDIWFMRQINSYYSSYEFMDYDSVKEDFKHDGGGMIHHLDEDNIEKLKEISKYIFPKKFDLEDRLFMQEFNEKLLNSFKTQIEDILSDYQSERNSEMNKVANESINQDLNEYFNEFGFTYISESELKTTAANLIMWYIRTNLLQLSIEKLLPKIFETNKTSLGGWHQNYYGFQNDEYFDYASFNNFAGRKLDEIIEKIEDGADKDFNMKEYINMVDRVSKKFEIGVWDNLPKNKNVRFKVENFEMNPNKVVVKLTKSLKQTTIKLSEENFYHLLYQPTLFNLEEI